MTPADVHAPAYAGHVAEVAPTVRATRSWAEMVAGLAAEHEAHVRQIEAFEKRADAHGERLSAVCADAAGLGLKEG